LALATKSANCHGDMSIQPAKFHPKKLTDAGFMEQLEEDQAISCLTVTEERLHTLDSAGV
jgi:hypothetical protein